MMPIWPGGSLRANFDSECSECGELIREGMAITYSSSHGGFIHYPCPTAAPAIQPGEISCRDCFLIHPEGKCDR